MSIVQEETVSLPNRALVLDGLDNLAVKPWPLVLPVSRNGKPIVPAFNVLVKVRASGICGSDVSQRARSPST